jgi:diguanylate cyclase (GGDEF)-like protein
MITFRPPASGKPQATLSIRARLLLLALIVVGPLMLDRARSIETDRAERIAALSEEALALSRQGLEAQQVVVVATRSLVQVVARAHATLGLTQQNCDRFLAGATSDTPWITGLSIVGANGRVTCSTVANSIGFDLSDRPYFQEALRTKAFVLGDFSVQRARGVRLVAAMPALEEDGRVAGVIAASIDLHWIERIGADVARRPGALMLVAEDTGTVPAAHPGRDAWLRKRFESNPLLRELQTRDSGLATVDGIDGMRRVFGFARLPQTSAYVAVGLDEAEMLRRVDAEMRMTYLQFALIGLFMLLGVWVGGDHAIVRPLRALARMAVHIGHGNLQIRTTRRRWAAEFVPLAGALDAMAQRLAEREEALRVANAHLEALARHDSLSGLANRRSFDAKLEEEWRESARHNTPLALVMIDVDHFKLYNDHYGHLAGDACLRAVGEALARTGEAAIVARYGGEEFALLFGGTAMEHAHALAERLRGGIESLALPHVIAPTGHVTVSVGVAALRAGHGKSAQALIEAADAALYAAKRRGRNTVVGHAEIHLLASA